MEEAEEEGDQLYGAGVLRGRRARPHEEDDDRCRLDADGDRAAGLPPRRHRQARHSGASECTERRPEAAAAAPSEPLIGAAGAEVGEGGASDWNMESKI